MIVCDASDDDSAKQCCSEYSSALDIVYLRAQRIGSSSQRNQAITVADGDLVVFLDDDSEAPEDLLNLLVSQASISPSVDLFVFPVKNQFPDPIDTQQGYLRKAFRVLFLFLPVHPHRRLVSLVGANGTAEPESTSLQPQWASGGAFACRQRFLQETRFPEEFERFGSYALGEDVFLTFGALQRGLTLTMLQAAPIRHHNASSGRSVGAKRDAASVYNRFLVWRNLIYPRRPFSVFAYMWSLFGDCLRLTAKTVATGRWDPVVGLTQALAAILSLLFSTDRARAVREGLGY